MLDPNNPYEAPVTGPTGAGAPSATTHFSHDDQADLFVASLPPILLKANAFVAALASAFLILFSIRLLLAVVQNPLAIFLEVGQCALGIAGFVVARGILRGSTFAWVVGLAVAPISGAASLFALVTGSVGGIFCGGLSVANVVLLAVNWESVKRIGMARKALRDGGLLA